MLKQICRKARLAVKLETSPACQLKDCMGVSLSETLIPKAAAESSVSAGAFVTGKAAKAGHELVPENDYRAILFYLMMRGEQHHRHDEQGLLFGSHVLSPTAVPLTHIRQHGRRFATQHVHEGNSMVWARLPAGGWFIGCIQRLWLVPASVAERERNFISIMPLDIVPQEISPYTQVPGLGCQLVYDRISAARVVIEPADLISHLAVLRRPNGTFGIKAPLMIVYSLNDGRVAE